VSRRIDALAAKRLALMQHSREQREALAMEMSAYRSGLGRVGRGLRLARRLKGHPLAAPAVFVAMLVLRRSPAGRRLLRIVTAASAAGRLVAKLSDRAAR